MASATLKVNVPVVVLKSKLVAPSAIFALTELLSIVYAAFATEAVSPLATTKPLRGPAVALTLATVPVSEVAAYTLIAFTELATRRVNAVELSIRAVSPKSHRFTVYDTELPAVANGCVAKSRAWVVPLVEVIVVVVSVAEVTPT